MSRLRRSSDDRRSLGPAAGAFPVKRKGDCVLYEHPARVASQHLARSAVRPSIVAHRQNRELVVRVPWAVPLLDRMTHSTGQMKRAGSAPLRAELVVHLPGIGAASDPKLNVGIGDGSTRLLWDVHDTVGASADDQYLGLRAENLVQIARVEAVALLTPPAGDNTIRQKDDVLVMDLTVHDHLSKPIRLDHRRMHGSPRAPAYHASEGLALP